MNLPFVLAVCAGGLCLAGCGEPGSPQPPSLNLPLPVKDLAAQRIGDTVHLTWSTTDRTTDHTAPTGTILSRICRAEGVSAALASGPTRPQCERVSDQRIKLGTHASYDDILPVTLTSGSNAASPTLLTYYVELVNHAQKSAGLSNPAYTATGAAPPALTGLAAKVRAEGVVLSWQPVHESACASCEIGIVRTLRSPAPFKNVKGQGEMGLSTPAPPVLEQRFTVSAGEADDAIDRTARFGQTYEYRARRVVALKLDGHPFEVLGPESAPVSIVTRDIFPPAVPRDLVAIADEGSKAIDLSWSADNEPDLAGYFVYRQNPVGAGREMAVRISGPRPLATPTFHDTDVKPGAIYAYTVSAVDQQGNESAQSPEADESLPPSQ